MTTELFEYEQGAPENQAGDSALEQYFTPEWAAEELRSLYFNDLTTSDLVIDPGCGRGAFIKAIPSEIPAIGIELDPQLAELAACRTGRKILCGDFRTIDIPDKPTVIFGNPPFSQSILTGFIDRARDLLPENGRCGFLLPAFAFQTPSTVIRWNEEWTLRSTMLPRTLFPRLSKPIVFVLFTKDRAKFMHGFSLYREIEEIRQLSKWAKVILVEGKPMKTTWRALVEESLRRCGGKAHLSDIYRVIDGVKPNTNKWWKEKVRQILQHHFHHAGDGVWALAA
jgi:hypothetical protein